MNAIYRLAGVCELALLILDGLYPLTALPLAGGHIQQIGIVFAGAFIVEELWAIVSNSFHRKTGRRTKPSRKALSPPSAKPPSTT